MEETQIKAALSSLNELPYFKTDDVNALLRRKIFYKKNPCIIVKECERLKGFWERP